MRKILAIVLTFLVIVSVFPAYPITASVYSEETQESVDAHINDAKFHFYFDDERYHNVYDDTTCIEAYAYIKNLVNKLDLDDTSIRVTIEFDDDFSKTSSFKKKEAKLQSAQTKAEKNEARRELTTALKDFHEERMPENIKLLSKLNAKEVREIKYSPFVRLNIDIDQIDINEVIVLAKNPRVVSISFALEDVATTTSSWNTVLEEIGAYETISSGTYTGEGLRIGILEAAGICEVNHKNLIGKNIQTWTKKEPEVISVHATRVTSIIALMLPDAELFVSDDTETIGVEWFIDNGCSVVNCSFVYSGNDQNADKTYFVVYHGYRADIDAVYEYQIQNSKITVVAAAGNLSTDNTRADYNPNNDVRSPGLAYNVITVGGLKRTLTLSGYKLEHDDYASYVSSVPYTKPEVSALMTIDVPDIPFDSGTSFATPQVTVCIAIMIDKFPTYFDRSPSEIKALLMANAKTTRGYSAEQGNFDDRVGAGCINLASMLDNWSRTREYTLPAGSSAGTQVASFSIVVPEGTTIQVSLAWLLFTLSENATNGFLTNYNIYLYDSSGAVVAQSINSGCANVELFRYTTEAQGTYRIVVQQIDNMNSNIPGETIHLAYSLN